jgi:hypothetical protein
MDIFFHAQLLYYTSGEEMIFFKLFGRTTKNNPILNKMLTIAERFFTVMSGATDFADFRRLFSQIKNEKYVSS